jgi:hypothetical protein
MIKKSYDTPFLEVIEIGFLLLNGSEDKPFSVDSPDVPMTNRDDWDWYDN